MKFKIERRTIVLTSIEIDESMVDMIKKDLFHQDYDYLDEIGEFDTMEDLMEIIKSDRSQHCASLIFEVVVNSSGHPEPNESFGEEDFDMFASE